MEYIVCLGSRPTSRSYGKGAVFDKPVCRVRVGHALGSKAVLAEASTVPVVGQAVPAAPTRVCSLSSVDGTLGLASFWSNTGCSVHFILQEVFLQDRVLEGSGIVVALCCHISFLFPLAPGALSSSCYFSLVLWTPGTLAINW